MKKNSLEKQSKNFACALLSERLPIILRTMVFCVSESPGYVVIERGRPHEKSSVSVRNGTPRLGIGFFVSNCCRTPIKSANSHSSTIKPFSILDMIIPVIFTCFPVAGSPINDATCLPFAVKRVATNFFSDIISSVSIWNPSKALCALMT